MDDLFTNNDLKNKIIESIPEDKRDAVLDSLVVMFIDNAPLKFIQQLTGEPEAFGEAELILKQFYQAETFESLIEDAMKLVGQAALCLHLDTLNLFSEQ
jgi:hypothetical protein|tara:strand:- start:1652 stop:1948 length:297 start_codon:yes stop_codon:yes gene_type:complete